MGRPIIASAVPGNRAIAHAGVNALLVPPENPAALAEALMELASDPERRRRLGAAGRRLAQDSLSAQAVASASAAVYRQVLDELECRDLAP